MVSLESTVWRIKVALLRLVCVSYKQTVPVYLLLTTKADELASVIKCGTFFHNKNVLFCLRES